MSVGTAELQRIAHRRRRAAPDLDALAGALREAVRGDVRFDAGYRAAYSTDSSNYRQAPLGVVCPFDADDVVAAMRTCHRLGAPMTFRGAATSLAGQTTNRAVVIDPSRHLRATLAVDAARRIARVQPGVTRDQLAKPCER
ncbi:MAG: FAD-binding oxidoreductase, partial [Solirubrobacteraceae bacterium]